MPPSTRSLIVMRFKLLKEIMPTMLNLIVPRGACQETILRNINRFAISEGNIVNFHNIAVKEICTTILQARAPTVNIIPKQYKKKSTPLSLLYIVRGLHSGGEPRRCRRYVVPSVKHLGAFRPPVYVVAPYVQLLNKKLSLL